GEVLDPHHPAVTEGRHLVVELRVDLNAAPPALPAMAKPRRHPVPGVDPLLWLQLQLLERLVDPFPEALHLVRPPARVRRLARREHPLDLGIELLDGCVEVAPVVRLDEIPGLCDVLL